MKKIFYLIACCTLMLSIPALSHSRDLEKILESGVLRVGTTGDYKPFSFDNNGSYEGFDIAVAKNFAKQLGVQIEFIPTTWPTLMADLESEKYDIGMSGITRTISRQKDARFSKGYVIFGKTPLVAREQAQRFTSLAAIDQKGMRIGVNPGGTNEKYVRATIKNAEIIVFESNLAIPKAVAAGEVDVMFTDSVEALHYAATNEKLAAPLADNPFTRAELGYLMSADAERLQDTVNFMLDQMVLQGEMTDLKKKYLHTTE